MTVLIHDQECAAELRRKRKRGKAAEPKERVWINERVCEGCGDCGEKSSCLSVIPVETEFGRKTHIHQASCNKDFSCLEGDCPSFLTVVPGEKAKHEVPALGVELPEPRRLVDAARLRRADDGHRRHRRRDRQPGARHGGADRRPARLGPRPDRPVAEGRPGDRRTCASRATRSRPRARRPRAASTCTSASTCWAPRAAKNLADRRPRAHGGGRLHQRGADRPHGHRRGRALPGARGASSTRSTPPRGASTTSTSTRSGSRSACSATT